MGGALAEDRCGFNHLHPDAIRRLTMKNKAGTLLRPSSVAVRPARYSKTGTTDMLAMLFSLFFLVAFWVAGSLALQELYDNRDSILRALSGQGGVRRV
jgi:hypothetical protein